MALKIKNLTIKGTVGDDELYGFEGNDKLNGLAGNDTLDGDVGRDTMFGGNGDDYYYVDNAKDVVTETNANIEIGGYDTVETTLLSYTLPKNIENLIFAISEDVKGMGNKLDNEISGDIGNDTFSGSLGDDTLIGGEGNDTAIFSNAKDQYEINAEINENGESQITVSFIGIAKKGVINDGEDTLIGVEYLQFSNDIINAKDLFPSDDTVDSPTIPESSQTGEATAPIIYQTNDVNQLDSITTLLTYSPAVANGTNYSTFEPEKWRTRASDSSLAVDLTQTQTLSNQFSLQGKLEGGENSQLWYKIKLTSSATLQVSDLSVDAAIIDVSVFNSDLDGSRYSFGVNPELHTYKNLPAGDYFVGIQKEADATVTQLNQPSDFKISIGTTQNVLKADAEHPKPAVEKDTNDNLVLTYSFDLMNGVMDTETLGLHPTAFSQEQKAATRLALQDYANIAKLKFVEFPNGSSEIADITFTNVRNLGSAAADTFSSTSDMNDAMPALIRVSASDESNNEVAVGGYGYSTLLHEIGHALGLKHPRSYGSGGGDSDLPYLVDSKDNNQYTLMSYNEYTNQVTDNNKTINLRQNSGATSEQTPLLYDIAAIQLLYGANTGYNATNSTYHWGANTEPFMSIWDASGVDRIDASNQTQPQIVDLRAGEFSSIGAATLEYSNGSTKFYPAKNNVSVAYGTIIEEAIGGSGNDTLIGNSFANQLTGNGGSDNFIFASQLSESNVDTITDFSSEDKLTLNRSIFSGLNGSNQLKSEAFLMGHSAENSLQRIIFDTLTHGLFYDSDGLGGAVPIEFAILSNVTQLNANQIFIQG